MSKYDQEKRQQLGCGWEPRAELVQIRPWSPKSLDTNWKGKIETCPGYTTALPEVIEIARARLHAKEFHSLREFCGGAPSETVINGMEILEGATNECTRWSMDTPQKAKA
jgi:hypothetical protein